MRTTALHTREQGNGGMPPTEAWGPEGADAELRGAVALLDAQFPRLPDVSGQFLHVPAIHTAGTEGAPIVPTEKLFSLPDEVLDSPGKLEPQVYTNTFLDTARGLQTDPQLRSFFTQKGLGDDESLSNVFSKKLSDDEIDGYVVAAVDYSKHRRKTLEIESQPGFTEAIDSESLERYNSLGIDERKAVATTLSKQFKDVDIQLKHAKSDIVNHPVLGQLIGADRIATINRMPTHSQVEALRTLKNELEEEQAAIKYERQVAAEKDAAEKLDMHRVVENFLQKQAVREQNVPPNKVVVHRGVKSAVISSQSPSGAPVRRSKISTHKGTGARVTAVALIASSVAPPAAALAQGLTANGTSTKAVGNVIAQSEAVKDRVVVPLEAPATPDVAVPPASAAPVPSSTPPAAPEAPAPAADSGTIHEIVPEPMAPPIAAPAPGSSGDQAPPANSAPAAPAAPAPQAAPPEAAPATPAAPAVEQVSPTPQAVAPVPAAAPEAPAPPAPGASDVTPVPAPAPTTPVLVEKPNAPLTHNTREDVIDQAWTNVQQIVNDNTGAIREKTGLLSLAEEPSATQTITNIDKLAHSIVVNRTHGEKTQADVDLLAKEMASVMVVARYPQLATDVLNSIDDKVLERAMKPARKDRSFQEDIATMIRNSIFDKAGGYTQEQEKTISNLLARAITVASPRGDERHEIKALLERRMGDIRWADGPSADAFVKGEGVKSVAVTQGIENGTIKHEVHHSPVSPAVGKGMSEKAKAKFHEYLQDASEEYDVPANFIAAFYYVENARTGDATNNADAASGTPATGNGNWREPAAPEGHGSPWLVSSAGASGPFQFIHNTFESVGVDADGNGVKDVTALKDATYSAAHLLKSNGAHKNATFNELWHAARRYNHSDTYAHSVMKVFKHLESIGHGAEHSVDTGKALAAHRAADNAAEAAAAAAQAQLAQAQAPAVVPAPAAVLPAPTAPAEADPAAPAPEATAPTTHEDDGIIVPIPDSSIVTAIAAEVQPDSLENSPSITADPTAAPEATVPSAPEADAAAADPAANPVAAVVQQSFDVIHDIAKETRDDEKQATAEAAAKHEIKGARNLGIHLTYVDGQPVMQRLYAIEGLKSSSQESDPGNKFYVGGANGEVIVNAEMAPKVVTLFEDVKDTYGITLTATSSYRTPMHQSILAGNNGNRSEVAAAGTSKHQAGAAIDFNIGGSMEATAYPFGPNGVRIAPGIIYKALSKLAPKHGLKQYSNEPWHFSLNGH